MTASALPPSAPLRLSVDHILADLELLQQYHNSSDEIDDNQDDSEDDNAEPRSRDAQDGESAAEDKLLQLIGAFDPSRLDAPAGDADIRSELRLIQAFLRARSLVSRYSSAPSALSSLASSIQNGKGTQEGSMQLDGFHARVAQMQSGVEQRERNWSRVLDALGPASGWGLLAEFSRLGRQNILGDGTTESGAVLDGAGTDTASMETSRALPISTSRRPAWDDDWESETLAPLPLPKELLSLSTSISKSPSADTLDIPSPRASPSPVDHFYDLSPQAEADESEVEDAWALQEEPISIRDENEAKTKKDDQDEVEDEEEEEEDAWALEDTSVLPSLLATASVPSPAAVSDPIPASNVVAAAPSQEKPVVPASDAVEDGSSLQEPAAESHPSSAIPEVEEDRTVSSTGDDVIASLAPAQTPTSTAPFATEEDDGEEEEAWALEDTSVLPSLLATASIPSPAAVSDPISASDVVDAAPSQEDPVVPASDTVDAAPSQEDPVAEPHPSSAIPEVEEDRTVSSTGGGVLASSAPAQTPTSTAPFATEEDDGEEGEAWALEDTSVLPSLLATASVPPPAAVSNPVPAADLDEAALSQHKLVAETHPSSAISETKPVSEIERQVIDEAPAPASIEEEPAPSSIEEEKPVPSSVQEEKPVPFSIGEQPASSSPIVHTATEGDDGDEDDAWAIDDGSLLPSLLQSASIAPSPATSDPVPDVSQNTATRSTTSSTAAPVLAPVAVEEDDEDAWAFE
ncbi:hypothetical protein A4X09_0g1040 [Tilletia walkeri]|uniref:Uncharacterized protein n=1 Tax=Tilletia walkeri TaxID=117179 RepID=A0A8X7NFY0_9BASI|nr:hypothetical protein A4X09_0g1040 [Tilletia walkeri]